MSVEARHLFDYLYEESQIKQKNEYDETQTQILLDLDEDGIEYIGSFSKPKFKSEEDYYGTIFEDIEDTQHHIQTQSDVKNYSQIIPGQRKRNQFWNQRQESFVCATGIAKENLNEHITNELEKLLKVYTNDKDIGRMHAYRKAISIVRACKYKIENPEQIHKLPGVGEKIRDKISEILQTGQLRKANALANEEKQIVIEQFSKVWGIGVQTAVDLYRKGLKTIEDLRKNEHLLNKNQKIGLKYYEELQERMPRDEVTEIYQIVLKQIDTLTNNSGVYESIPCGSYRRGKSTCGDVDILITRKDGLPFDDFLMKLVQLLENDLLTDHLVIPKIGSHGSSTYMGICKLPSSIHRRIDFKIYPREQFGYAVLYFTGSDYFNRSMRLFARKKGYSLSDHGLYPVSRVKNEKVWSGNNIPCYTEQDVFNVLELPYKSPNERDV